MRAEYVFRVGVTWMTDTAIIIINDNGWCHDLGSVTTRYGY